MAESTPRTWTAKQDALACLLAAGSSVKAAAKKSNICHRTAYLWLAKPGFRGRVTEIRQEMLDHAIGGLSALAGSATYVLGKLLADESAAIRLRAATTVLDNVVKLRTFAELEARIVAIEQANEQTTHR